MVDSCSEVAKSDAEKESEARCKAMLDKLISEVKKQIVEIEDLAVRMNEIAVGLKAIAQPQEEPVHALPPPGTAPTATLVTKVDHAVAATTSCAEAAHAPESPTKCSTSSPDTNADDLQVVAESDPETEVLTVSPALAEHSLAPSPKLFSTIKQDTLMPTRYSTICSDRSIGTVASTHCLRECPRLVAGDISVTNLIIVGSVTCIMGLQLKPPWPPPQGLETVLKLFHKQAQNIMMKTSGETRRRLAVRGYIPQDGFVMGYFPVPPNCLRAFNALDDSAFMCSSDTSTNLFRKILRKILEIKGSRLGSPNFQAHEVEADYLQIAIADYIKLRGTTKGPRDISFTNQAAPKQWQQQMKSLFISKSSSFSCCGVITGDLFLGATPWSTVVIDDATTTVVEEAIILAAAPTLSVCLSNASIGQPFISTLEFRQFNGLLYYTTDEAQFFLTLSSRINFGAESNESVKYPDDPFDRIWESDSVRRANYLVDVMEIYKYVQITMGSQDANIMASSVSGYPQTGWAQEGGDPCLPASWSWVQYSSELAPKVFSITLTGKNTTGSIPVELTKLSASVELGLHGNSISGENEIPDFSGCRNLQYIHLENNQLTSALTSMRSPLLDCSLCGATVRILGFGPVAPFDAAVCFLAIGMAIILSSWSENYGEPSDSKDLMAQFKVAAKASASDEKIALLGAIQSLLEVSMYTFVFLWTSALSPNDEEIPHGCIFATFMPSSMLGSISSGACLQLLGFCIFESCVDIFWLSIMKMRYQYILEEARSTIMDFFCIPLNLFVCVVLYKASLEDLPDGETEQNSELVELFPEPMRSDVTQGDLIGNTPKGVPQGSDEVSDALMVSTLGLFIGDLGCHDAHFLDSSCGNLNEEGYFRGSLEVAVGEMMWYQMVWRHYSIQVGNCGSSCSMEFWWLTWQRLRVKPHFKRGGMSQTTDRPGLEGASVCGPWAQEAF